MSISIYTPVSPKNQLVFLKPNQNLLLLGDSILPKRVSFARRRCTTRALLSYSKDSVLKEFHEKKALKVSFELRTYSSICLWYHNYAKSTLLLGSLEYLKKIPYAKKVFLKEFNTCWKSLLAELYLVLLGITCSEELL